jgi:hypothetical protein
MRLKARGRGFTLIKLWHEANTIQIAQLNNWTVMKPAVANTDRDVSRFFQAVPEKVPVH